jgi:hypothetical protein
LPSSVSRYADPTTEFPVFRLTNPDYTSALPPHYARAVSHKGNFLLCSGDESGSPQAYRLDLKNGQARLLTDAENFDPACFTLLADERSFCYADRGGLQLSSLTSLRPRQVYPAQEGFQATGLSITDDGLSAALVEQKGSRYRLQWIRMMDGMATTLVDANQQNDEISDPAPRICALPPGRRRVAGQYDRPTERREAELSPPSGRRAGTLRHVDPGW